MSLALSGTALAEQGMPAPAAPPQQEVDTAEEPKEDEPKAPGQGDFDAGGQVRLPSGPDEMGEYASFNWVALDIQGRYFLLDSVTVNGEIPLAIIKPDTFGGTIEPSMIGGISVRLEAEMPHMPLMPPKEEMNLKLLLAGTYMREGAMLLSKKDFPLFVGDFQPGFAAGTYTRVKLGSVVDFEMSPAYVYQSGEVESLTALQVPTSTVLSLGSLVKLSADAGVFTGDDFSLKGSNGGRISAGGSLTVKIGPILAHAGAGVASLLTGGMYPTIGDSFYVDLNVKFAK